MKKAAALVFLFSFLIFSLSLDCFSQKKLKVYISVDMEGIAGVVDSDQTSSSGKDYNLARKWMTEEVNAAIRGSLKTGATEIVVNDSHGSMRNIIASDLIPSAYLITGAPKPYSMMQGLDKTFDAVIFIGYHAMAGTVDGVLDHTISGSTIFSIKINGREMAETHINALLAGAYNVPVVLVAGDSAICWQAKEILGEELETAPVKEGIGRNAAKTLTPSKACELIQEKTKLALGKRARIKPFHMDPPYQFDVVFHNSSQADRAELVPQVKRENARSVHFESEDILEGFKLLRALIYLASS